MKYVWINGSYLEAEKASLKIGDLALQRGYGVFDFFRCINGLPFLLKHYLDRFYHSAAAMRLNVPVDKKELTSVVQEFLLRNEAVNCGVKILLTGGYAHDGYTPVMGNLILSQHLITAVSKEKYLHGFKVMTHAYLREFPSVKSINYLRGIFLISEIKARGLDDVLYHHQQVISEFPRSNFFMVHPQRGLITPGQDILQGITRKCVLALASDHYATEEGKVTLKDLKVAREAFLTSTTKGILPLCEVDGKPVGSGTPGPVTKHLTHLLNNVYNDSKHTVPSLDS